MDLYTERLLIRKILKTDAEAIFELRSNEENLVFFDMQPYENIGRAERFIGNVMKDMESGEIFFWVICNRESEKVIGTICLWSFSKDKKRAEVGYELIPMEQGKGYGYEALEQIKLFGKDNLNLEELDAITHKNHRASIKLLVKSGFEDLGYVQDIMPEAEEGPDMKLFRFHYL